MKLVFFGSPEFALDSLRIIHESEHEILAVISQPDKPKGRGRILQTTPVSLFAQQTNLKLMKPQDLNEDSFTSQYKALKPEINVVIAYGRILPEWIIEFPEYKTINAHASLLPKYRGAAPITRAILTGEKATGVSIVFITKKLDAGDIIFQENVEIKTDDNARSLSKKLSALSADLFLKTLDLIKVEKLPTKKQDESQVSYAAKISKAELRIDFSQSSKELLDKIRAFYPKPGAYTVYEGKRLKILEAAPTETKGECGQVINIDKGGVTIGTKDGAIKIKKVKAEGKNEMSAYDYSQGHRVKEGEIF
ncbi:MAG: methionyl-tRNA formyltransferase [Actinobacteria bacterium]|nr:MAG: methionyl-tRNA formyltransferase [Actinomycetota bacterium]